MATTKSFTGSNPDGSKFNVMFSEPCNDWCCFLTLADGTLIERYVATWNEAIKILQANNMISK